MGCLGVILGSLKSCFDRFRFCSLPDLLLPTPMMFPVVACLASSLCSLLPCSFCRCPSPGLISAIELPLVETCLCLGVLSGFFFLAKISSTQNAKSATAVPTAWMIMGVAKCAMDRVMSCRNFGLLGLDILPWGTPHWKGMQDGF